MSHYTVGDLVAEFLEHCGVQVAFGIASVHNVPTLDAIGRRGKIQFVTPRGEAGAAHMAEGYARAGNRLGVFITSTGPAAANAMPGLMEALLAASPVLHITGQTATPHLGRDQGTTHDLPRQLEMLSAVSKAAYRISSVDTALGILVKAVTEALTPPRGPVSIEIPIDLQRKAVARPSSMPAISTAWIGPKVSEAQISELADIVKKARRPLLWTGSGALHASRQVERLLDLGFGLTTSWSGRGVVSEEDDRVLGAYNTGLSKNGRRTFAEADLLLVAGSRVRGQQTRDLQDELPKPLVQIDVDRLAHGRTYPAELFVQGDTADVLQQLADRLEGSYRADSAWQPAIAAAKADAMSEYRQSLGVYASYPAALRDALPRDAILVRDLTWHSVWAHYGFTIFGPGCSIFPTTGAIGSGLQTSIGAALAQRHRKTVLLSGDGGFFMHHGEIWTAIAEEADLLMIVMNDRTYRLIEHVQDALTEGRHFFSKLKNPDLRGVAELAGMPFWRVTDTARFGPTVKEAIAGRGPRLIEVDMTQIGAAPSAYVPPPYAKKVTP